MARIRWQGVEFTADPIRKLPNGNWLMTSLAHGPRITIGTEIEVTPDEVVDMSPAEAERVAVIQRLVADGVPVAEGQAELEAAMAEERKLLPSPRELIAKAPKTVMPDTGDA